MREERVDQDLRRRIVGDFFRKERIRAGLTQADLARRLEYTTAQFVSNWERGVALPPLATLPKLARLLGVSPDVVIKVMIAYEEERFDAGRRRLLSAFEEDERRAS